MALSSVCHALWSRADVLGSPALWGELTLRPRQLATEGRRASLLAWLARHSAGLRRLEVEGEGCGVTLMGILRRSVGARARARARVFCVAVGESYCPVCWRGEAELEGSLRACRCAAWRHSGMAWHDRCLALLMENAASARTPQRPPPPLFFPHSMRARPAPCPALRRDPLARSLGPAPLSDLRLPRKFAHRVGAEKALDALSRLGALTRLELPHCHLCSLPRALGALPLLAHLELG